MNMWGGEIQYTASAPGDKSQELLPKVLPAIDASSINQLLSLCKPSFQEAIALNGERTASVASICQANGSGIDYMRTTFAPSGGTVTYNSSVTSSANLAGKICQTGSGNSGHPGPVYIISADVLLKLLNKETLSHGKTPVTENATATQRQNQPMASEEKQFYKAFADHKFGIELSIIHQPECNHRARYRTEGSRGSIKDRSGIHFPTVQLKGYNGPSGTLLVYAANETGCVRPHSYYRLIKAGGKKTSRSRERLIGSLHVIEMDLTEENNWTVSVDCVGIMKLRDADLKKRKIVPSPNGNQKFKPATRSLRLAFRAVLPVSDGEPVILQTVSSVVSCSAAPGVPEIHYISHDHCDVMGGLNIVLLGRNFVLDETNVFIVQNSESEEVLWEKKMTNSREHFHRSHIVAIIPPYIDLAVTCPVNVQIVVRNNDKESEPVQFSYMPRKEVGVLDEKTTGTCGEAACTGTGQSSLFNAESLNNDEKLFTELLLSIFNANRPTQQIVQSAIE